MHYRNEAPVARCRDRAREEIETFASRCYAADRRHREFRAGARRILRLRALLDVAQ
jgi:hypothetical protein